MNEPPKSTWEKMLEEPRRFFLWLAAFSLGILILLFVLGNLLRHTPPASVAWAAGGFVLVGGIGCFLAGFLGFFLALIPPLKPVCRWLVRRSALLAVCLVTLVALFYAQENWRGQRAWAAFKREAIAKNESLELQQIIPPTIPEDQNFAATPLLKDLCNEFDPGWRQAHPGPNGVVNEADRLKLKFEREQQEPLRGALTDWSTGRRADLRAWQEYYRNPKLSAAFASGLSAELTPEERAQRAAFAKRYGAEPGEIKTRSEVEQEMKREFPLSPQAQSPAADVLLALSKYDAVVEELRLAGQRPQARFPIRYEDGFSALLPHLARMKGLNQFLALRSAAELEAGLVEKAAADVKLGLRLAELVRDEPLLISQLVRLAQIQLAVNPLWEGLIAHRWNEAQLAGFEQQLSGVDLLAGYQLGMRGERAFCTWTIDYVRNERRMDVLDLALISSNPTGEQIFAQAMFHLVPRGWFDQNKASVGRMHLEMFLPVVDVKSHRVAPAEVNQMALRLEQNVQDRSLYNWFARLLLPALGRAAMQSAKGQVSVDLARLAVALERHRLAQGEYPPDLAALAPRFLAKVPPDVVSGVPYVYHRTGDGSFELYSIGWNEIDDGGHTVLLEQEKLRANWEAGDWVWHMVVK